MILQSNSKCKHVLSQNGLQLKVLIKIDIEHLNDTGKHIVDQLVDFHIDDDIIRIRCLLPFFARYEDRKILDLRNVKHIRRIYALQTSLTHIGRIDVNFLEAGIVIHFLDCHTMPVLQAVQRNLDLQDDGPQFGLVQ